VTLGPPPKWSAPHTSTPAHHLSAIDVESTGDPALDYTLHCQGCHRADGSGTPGAIPELRGSMARFLHVAGGRDYLARVPGVAQSTLDDGALAALLNWMVVRFDPQHVPRDFRPYDAAEIEMLRRSPLVRWQQVRAGLLVSSEPAHSLR
jgi:hypothetical protein